MKRARHIEYCKPWAHGRSWQGLRFVENVHDGLRFVNYADEVAREAGCYRSISHSGWYTSDDCHETLRGVVFRLGRGLFVPGYVTTDTHEARGNSRVFDSCVLAFNDTTTDAMHAAKLADQLAESVAESEREYNEAWRAGNDYTRAQDEARDAWQELKALARERFAARNAGADYPALCKAISSQARDFFRTIEKARERMKTLFSDFGKHEAFNEGKNS